MGKNRNTPEKAPERLLTATIPGEPHGKGRPRFSRHGHAYTPQKTREYENHVAGCVMAAMDYEDGPFPLDEPIRVEIRFYLREPKRPRFPVPAVRPDLDNLEKAVIDGMQLAGAIRDDARIVDVKASKRYSDTPGTIVNIWKWETK